jgi:hypothetical protein
LLLFVGGVVGVLVATCTASYREAAEAGGAAARGAAATSERSEGASSQGGRARPSDFFGIWEGGEARLLH